MSVKAIVEAVQRRMRAKREHLHVRQYMQSGNTARCACGKDTR